MKTIKDVKARMTPGTRLVCVENTYRPELNGTERVVQKSGPSVVSFLVDGEPGFRMEWGPGIVILDPDTFSMPLKRADHKVTLRFVGEA